MRSDGWGPRPYKIVGAVPPARNERGSGTMKDIASVVVEFIERAMKKKGLELYISGENKYVAMDGDYNTRFKFDLSFSDNAFVCHSLIHGDQTLVLSHSVNISWTDGSAIRDFFQYIESL